MSKRVEIPQTGLAESSLPKKVTILPPADKEGMAIAEAIHEVNYRYSLSGHDPSKHPRRYRRKIEERKREIERYLSLDSNALTTGKRIS